MRNLLRFCLLTGLILAALVSRAQDSTSAPQRVWVHHVSLDFYILRDDFLVVPQYRGDRRWMHIEGRANYEARNTLSGWFGYNIDGGRKFRFKFTPMAGIAFGDIKGLAPGLEISLDYVGLKFYSQSEYLFDLNSPNGDYFYTWSELTYSPLKWFWFGVNAQRTPLFPTSLDIQPAFLVGFGAPWWGFSGYVYNLGLDDTPYFLLGFKIRFPEP
jgi:hypothetical protein